MYLRLAFSVAVHLQTEVLIMDEVLAVGDVSFQQKCLDKMHEIRNEGRTILFVSHGMAAVTRLCERAILLDKGEMISDGPAYQVVNEYLGTGWQVTSHREWPAEQAPANEVVRLLKVRAVDQFGATAESLSICDSMGIELTYEVLHPGQVLTPRVQVINEEGVTVFTSHDVGERWRREERPVGAYTSTVRVPGNFLSGGNLLVDVSIMSHVPATVMHLQAPHVITFQVVDNYEPQSARGDYVGPIPGIVRPLLEWDTDFEGKDSEPQMVAAINLA
jgi:lipopolysaccharide transport system ATP-binding protein